MISLYRPVRYSDCDTFIFQGDIKDINAIKALVNAPFRIYPTKKGFETGDFLYLRDGYRDQYFDLIKNYLRQNYEGPQIQLSVFRTNKPLSTLWPIKVWSQKVNDALKTFFQNQGCLVKENPHSKMVEVLPKKPKVIIEEVEIYQGLQFFINLDKENFPLLWISENFWFYRDNQPVSQERLSRLFEDTPDSLKNIRSITTRSSEEQFDSLKKIIQWVQPLTSCEDIHFDEIPLSATDLNMATWFWLHDTETTLEGDSGFQTTLAQSLFDKEDGFFNSPDDIAVIFIVPKANTSSIIPDIDWKRVVFTAHSFLSIAMSKVNVPFQVFEYPVIGDSQECVNSITQFTKNNASKRVLCFLIAQGKKANRSSNVDEIAANQQTAYLSRNLRDCFRGGYMETLDWNNLSDQAKSKFTIQNAMMAGLYRLGAQPWRLKNLSFNSTIHHSTYFLGIAGNIEKDSYAAVIIDYRGMLIGYVGDCPVKDQTENDSKNRLEEIVQNILYDGIHQTYPQPTHIIVHLSPELNKEAMVLGDKLKTMNLNYDIISIHPNSSVRFLQANNQMGTPSNSVAVGSETDGIAYLMNTLSAGERTHHGFVYPSPAPVKVQKHGGSSSLMTLSAQVYWLSVVHINSLHRTVDKPITIDYAQTLLNHILQTNKPMRVTKNYKKTLFWL